MRPEKRQEIEYYIDKEKRVVVAKLPSLSKELGRMIRDIAINRREEESALLFGTEIRVVEKLRVPLGQGLTAKATCSPADDFNVYEGMRIARERLLKKINKWRVKVLRQYLSDIELEREIFMAALDKYVEKYPSEEEE